MKHRSRVILLLAITALNLADLALTVYLIRTGVGTEANPIMRTAGIAAVKICAVPIMAGLTYYTADLAERQGSPRIAKFIDSLIVLVLGSLAFIVANNIGVWIFHCGILNVLGGL